jgi:hypothetical protein
MRVVFLVLAFVAFSTAAFAKRWSEPGWYQISDGLIGIFIYGGPYSDEDSCRRTLPRADQHSSFTCDYLFERPSYDD